MNCNITGCKNNAKIHYMRGTLEQVVLCRTHAHGLDLHRGPIAKEKEAMAHTQTISDRIEMIAKLEVGKLQQLAADYEMRGKLEQAHAVRRIIEKMEG